jgi:hypothetical protein
MKMPVQAKPVDRKASLTGQNDNKAVVQSGCCVQVAGQCLVSSPLC